MKINRLEIPNIVRAYTTELIPVIELSGRYGITRSGIYSILHAAGVSTRYEVSAHIKTTCDNEACGKEIDVVRSVYRKRLRNFCKSDCYYEWLNRENKKHPLVSNRQGMRVAKKVVESTGFFVDYGMVVHHEDRNNLNNELHNLRVFKSNGEHVQYHRGGGTIPIWDGRDHPNKPSPEIKRHAKHIASTEKI